MKKIIIGIVDEGTVERESIEIILDKIFVSKGYSIEVDQDKHFQAGSGILKKVPTYVRLMFLSSDPVQMATFFTDQDEQIDNLVTRIEDQISSVDPLLLPKCAIGVPNPHFERWLMADTDAVKRVFNISSKKALPYRDKSPKIHLQSLQRNMDRPSKTLYKCYQELALNFNSELVRKACPDFDKFYKSLEETLKAISEQ
jgi:hypothetical protein